MFNFVKKMKYTLEQFKKFAKEIEAYENGKAIEIYDISKGVWVYQEFMSFYPNMEYRIKRELSREEITQAWVKENNLKIGDRVKVTKGFEGESFGFYMNSAVQAIGSTCEVKDVTNNWIALLFESDTYFFPVECLEKIKEEWIPFGIEDWDYIKNAWLVCSVKITTTKSIQRINGINLDSETILIGKSWVSLKRSFAEYTFEDGTPFGKLKTL